MAARKPIKAILEKQGNMHCIPVSAAAAAPFIKTGNRRVLCTINGSHSIHAALMPRKDKGDYYLYAGKALLKKMNLSPGAVLAIQLEADESDYQFAMPEELAEVLNTDDDAHRVFHQLTPGRQRGLIQLVLMVK